MTKYVFKDKVEEQEFEKEMNALFETYDSLFEEAYKQDINDLAGKRPLDYDGNVSRFRREFIRKYKDIRNKYGMISDGRLE